MGSLEFAQQMADRYGVTVDFVVPRKKVSQRSVDYRPAELDEPSMRSNDNERCGNCVMYHASKCDLVEGFIQPDYVCDKWAAKPESIELTIGQRHVRTVRGEYFFKEPIGTPITEAEYQQLLAQRLAAKKEHEVGHPARVAAERAVRTARRMRGDVDTPTPPQAGGKGDAAQDAADKAALEKQAQAKLAQIKQQVAVTKGTATRSPGRSTQEELTAARARLAQLQQERAGRQLGRNANTAQRATDRRISQGQTVSHFTHPDTGAMMSKSEIGDTYEQLFATHGANLLEREFNGTYRMISHAQGGARNTPLDFQLNDTYGGELKTMSSGAKSQKTAIKKEEIDRKHLAIAKRGLQPLMVVQVVDQQTGTVTVYVHNAFASKKVSTMHRLGTYRYTASDFRDAQKQAGYARGGAMGRSELAPSSVLDRAGLSSGQAARAEAALDKQRALVPDLAGLKRVYFSKELPGGEENGHWTPNNVGLHPKLFTANADAWQARTEESGHHPKTGASALDYEAAHEVGHQIVNKIWDRGNFAELEKAVGAAYPGVKSFGVQRINPGLISDYGGYGGINEALAELWAEQSLSARPRNPQLRDTMLRLAGYGPPISEAARLTDDERYQRLLDARKEAQRRYPVGDPRRVAAERAVRQARKVIHGGPTPNPRPTPKPPAPRIPPTARPGVKPDWVPQYEPTPPVSLGSGKVPATITHEYSWSKNATVNRAFQEQAKRAVETQLKNQAGFVKELLTRTDTGETRPVEVAVTDNLRSMKGGSSSLGSYTGTDSSGTLRLHPKIFPHSVGTPDGRIYDAPFRGGFENEPAQVLFEQLKSNWWVPTDRKWSLSDNVIAHEVGHGVNFSAFSRSGGSLDTGIPDDDAFWQQFANVLSRQTGYQVTTPEASPISRPRKFWKPNEPSVETTAEILYSDAEKWGTRNRAAIEKGISRYAAGGTENVGTPREMFAELWSEYTLSSNPRPIAKFYGDYVSKLLNDRNRTEVAKSELNQAILRGMPADVRSFDPRSLSLGQNITFLSPHVRISRLEGHWEITILRPDGSFQGAYGRKTPEEVTALIESEYIRQATRQRGNL